MDENKSTYTLQELFDDLPTSLSRLAKESDLNEVTLARIRDGARTRRDTANKLLRAFSQIYGKELNTRNVTGINLMVNKRLEKKSTRESKQSEIPVA